MSATKQSFCEDRSDVPDLLKSLADYPFAFPTFDDTGKNMYTCLLQAENVAETCRGDGDAVYSSILKSTFEVLHVVSLYFLPHYWPIEREILMRCMYLLPFQDKGFPLKTYASAKSKKKKKANVQTDVGLVLD